MGLFRYRADSLGKLLLAWARLGPLSVKSQGTAPSHRRLDRDCSAAIAHPTGWRGGFPTGRPWDFAKSSFDDCVNSFHPARSHRRALAQSGVFTLPDPISQDLPPFAPRYHGTLTAWVRREGNRRTLSSRSFTPLAVTLTRLAFTGFLGPD